MGQSPRFAAAPLVGVTAETFTAGSLTMPELFLHKENVQLFVNFVHLFNFGKGNSIPLPTWLDEATGYASLRPQRRLHVIRSRRQHALHQHRVVITYPNSESGPWGKQPQEPSMRKGSLTVVATAAIGFAAISVASAGPINAAPLGKAAAAIDSTTPVQHWRWGSGGGHWRWGSRGGCRRCNRWRCWWVC
jgi:hypothetical protein